GQAAIGPQTLISAAAVRMGMRGPPGGKPGRTLVLRSRCRSRSTSTRRRGRPARIASRRAAVSGAGRLAVAAPDRVVVITARRAAVNDISRGWTGWPARLPLPAGMAIAAAARAAARAGAAAMEQAAGSWGSRAGDSAPEDGHGVLGHPDGGRDAAAGDLRQVGAVGQEVPGPAQRYVALDADQHVSAGREHPLDAGDAGEVPV